MTEDGYEGVQVGDPAPDQSLVNDQVCGFRWLPEGDDPAIFPPWFCTRSIWHAPPHIAAGMTQIVAIHQGDES